jgi:glutamate racemase
MNGCTQLISIATPELVPLIEQCDYTKAYSLLKTVIEDQIGKIDAVILGCTHYTVFREQIINEFGVSVLSQDEIIPAKLIEYLQKHPEVTQKLTQGNSMNIFLTEEIEVGTPANRGK